MKTVQILAIQDNRKAELITSNQTGWKDSSTSLGHSWRVRAIVTLNVSHTTAPTTAPPTTGHICKIIEAAPCIDSWGSRGTRVVAMQEEVHGCRSTAKMEPRL